MKSLLSKLARTDPFRWYLPNKLMRWQLVQHAIDTLAARTYLEIGVDEGESFCAIEVPMKIGVDPVSAKPAVARALTEPGTSYFQVTSDEFFEKHAAAALPDGVDVVFVDGLHTYGQTDRDITNALRHLRPGGVILVHDCLPASAEEACPAPTYEEARRMNGPSWNGLWTGDGWKAIVAARAGLSGNARACVLNCDHGVGLVWREGGAPPERLSLTREDIAKLDYASLMASTQILLGLCRPSRLRSVLTASTLVRRG